MSEILLIDAENPFAGDMKAALEGVGFQVHMFDDGKAGLEHARASAPSLIVLCAELPKQSGYSICNKLKKDKELKEIPLIITSSEATPETFAQHRKLKTRAEDYLIKPFEAPALLEKIGALVEIPGGDGGEVQLDEGELAALEVDSGGDNLDFADLSEADALLDGLDDSALGAGLDDDADADALLAGLDEGNDLEAEAALDGLELDASLDSLDASPEPAPDLGALDDALAGLEAEPEPAPAPQPTSAVVEGTPSTLPSSAADLAALNAARRENTDLKARVVELESKLKHAEEQASEAKADLEASKSTGSASARETLDLKKKIREGEKELMALKDEIFQKEEAVVEVQEELEKVKGELHTAQDAVSGKDTELASLKARVDALTQERDELENQVGERLAAAEQEIQDLNGKIQAAENDHSATKGKLYDAEQRISSLEGEVASKNSQLDDALNRLKSEEDLRQKAKEALEIGLTLLSGDSDSNEGMRADA